MNNSCERIEDLMLHGMTCKMASDEERDVAEHVARCDACRAVQRAMQHDDRQLDAYTEEISRSLDGLPERVMLAIENQANAVPRPVPLWRKIMYSRITHISTAAALLIAVTCIFLMTGHRQAFAQAIQLLEQVASMRIDIAQQTPGSGTVGEGGSEQTATIWSQGEKAFLDLPDRKVWRDGSNSTTYYPESGKVVIQQEEEHALDSSPFGMHDGKALAKWLRELEAHGFQRASYARETINGREYQRISVPPTNAENVELVLFVDAKEQRLDYMGWRRPDSLPKSWYDVWMTFTYNPEIDPEIFLPKYPTHAKIQRSEKPPDKQQVLRKWRDHAITTVESQGLEAGVFEAWLSPDGWLVLHLYVVNKWSTGTTQYPADVFGEDEMKGGFSRKVWENQNALLEWPAGFPTPNYTLFASGTSVSGMPLQEAYYSFRLPKPATVQGDGEEAVLHLWMLRHPSHHMDWRKGYTKEKANYVYCTLRIPIPEKATLQPSEQFILGMSPSGNSGMSLRLRLWILRHNGAKPEESLAVIDAQPKETQYELRWRKAKLLKTLGRQDDLDAFLRNCVPYIRASDPKYGNRNAERILDEYGSPQLRRELGP